MSAVLLKEFLGWCVVLNYILLLIWAGFLIFAHDWMYRMHTRWFRLTVEQFDQAHYVSVAIFKIVVFVFTLIPYLALVIIL